MREIKFRAWDKMGHRLVMPEDILLIDFEAEVLSYKEKKICRQRNVLRILCGKKFD